MHRNVCTQIPTPPPAPRAHISVSYLSCPGIRVLVWDGDVEMEGRDIQEVKNLQTWEMEWCWGEREGNVMETPGYWLVEINGQGAIPWDGEWGERSKSTPHPTRVCRVWEASAVTECRGQGGHWTRKSGAWGQRAGLEMWSGRSQGVTVSDGDGARSWEIWFLNFRWLSNWFWLRHDFS